MSAMANFKGFVLALVMAVRKPLAWLVLMRHNVLQVGDSAAYDKL
jgi:hypothetical protein